MRSFGLNLLAGAIIAPFLLSSCVTTMDTTNDTSDITYLGYDSRLPQHISSPNTVLIDPNVHAWGAYDADGNLIKAGLATAGGDWCPDINRRCHTSPGTFRVYSLGSVDCKSSRYPIPKGGAPMPYCMYFNGNQAMHGSHDNEVVEGNISHGCVRMHVSDAEWLRFNFVTTGTRVIVKPY